MRKYEQIIRSFAVGICDTVIKTVQKIRHLSMRHLTDHGDGVHVVVAEVEVTAEPRLDLAPESDVYEKSETVQSTSAFLAISFGFGSNHSRVSKYFQLSRGVMPTANSTTEISVYKKVGECDGELNVAYQCLATPPPSGVPVGAGAPLHELDEALGAVAVVEPRAHVLDVHLWGKEGVGFHGKSMWGEFLQCTGGSIQPTIKTWESLPTVFLPTQKI